VVSSHNPQKAKAAPFLKDEVREGVDPTNFCPVEHVSLDISRHFLSAKAHTSACSGTLSELVPLNTSRYILSIRARTP
jgi:hypothetical protein